MPVHLNTDFVLYIIYSKIIRWCEKYMVQFYTKRFSYSNTKYSNTVYSSTKHSNTKYKFEVHAFCAISRETAVIWYSNYENVFKLREKILFMRNPIPRLFSYFCAEFRLLRVWYFAGLVSFMFLQMRQRNQATTIFRPHIDTFIFLKQFGFI